MNLTSNGGNQRGISPGARLVDAPHLRYNRKPCGHDADRPGNPVLCDFMDHQYSAWKWTGFLHSSGPAGEKKLGADFIKIMATGGLPPV